MTRLELLIRIGERIQTRAYLGSFIEPVDGEIEPPIRREQHAVFTKFVGRAQRSEDLVAIAVAAGKGVDGRNETLRI